MYYPYVRGKQFELLALEHVNPAVYRNTLPIVEPVTATTNRVANGIYGRLATANSRMILIVNPAINTLSEADVRRHLVNGLLLNNINLVLGYLVKEMTTPAQLRVFLTSDLAKQKAVIFQANFVPATLNSFVREITRNQPAHLIFDSRRTSHVTQNAFIAHPHRVLITDGFQSQDRNADYPSDSVFVSDCLTYTGANWNGIGDYQTVGDNYREGGGPPYVVTLHITRNASGTLMTQHYSSVTDRTLPGQAPMKFTEACDALVADRVIRPLRSTGMVMYRGWNTARRFPQLGAAKQASIQHHIELLSSLV